MSVSAFSGIHSAKNDPNLKPKKHSNHSSHLPSKSQSQSQSQPQPQTQPQPHLNQEQEQQKVFHFNVLKNIKISAMSSISHLGSPSGSVTSLFWK